jgi:hypothetical protein
MLSLLANCNRAGGAVFVISWKAWRLGGFTAGKLSERLDTEKNEGRQT